MIKTLLEDLAADGVFVIGGANKAKWKEFAQKKKIPNDKWLKVSDGCLTQFKSLNDIQLSSNHNESGSVNPALIEEKKRGV